MQTKTEERLVWTGATHDERAVGAGPLDMFEEQGRSCVRYEITSDESRFHNDLPASAGS